VTVPGRVRAQSWVACRDVDEEQVAPDEHGSLQHRLAHRWRSELDAGQRSAVIAWASFAATFGAARAVTHWIRDGHGPSGGGVNAGGTHLHHYNLGILLLSGLGAITIRGKEEHRRHPSAAAVYGVANALIVDEAALLLDLKDVYWAKQGRTSVDIAIALIAAGGLAVTSMPLWPRAQRKVRR
jgi:hypothetical protein